MLQEKRKNKLWKEAFMEAIKYFNMSYMYSDNELGKLSNQLFFYKLFFEELKERGLLNNKQKSLIQKKFREITYFLLMNDERFENNEKIKKEIELFCLNNSFYWMGLGIRISSFDN